MGFGNYHIDTITLPVHGPNLQLVFGIFMPKWPKLQYANELLFMKVLNTVNRDHCHENNVLL